MIGQQPNAPQIQVRKNLCAKADLALCLALTLRQRRQTLVAVKRKRTTLSSSFDRKSLRTLMQINQRSPSRARDGLHGTFNGGMAIAAGRTKHVSHHAMRMHPHQYRLAAAFDVTAH